MKSNESPEIDRLIKMEDESNGPITQGYADGKKLYQNYCLSCHKSDKSGEPSLYPSLIDLKKRMTESQVLDKIQTGGGRMPSFAGAVKGHEKSIIDYLFEKQDKPLSEEENALLEIRGNTLSNIEAGSEKSKTDTATRYLNVTAYALLKGPDGNPAIKPPWGTLNAINLNTGDYEWTIPVGNHPDLQQKGQPITGATSSPGPIVTYGGLVFISGTRDRKFQAFDKTTGKLLWETTLPGFGSSSPATYMVSGNNTLHFQLPALRKILQGTLWLLHCLNSFIQKLHILFKASYKLFVRLNAFLDFL